MDPLTMLLMFGISAAGKGIASGIKNRKMGKAESGAMDMQMNNMRDAYGQKIEDSKEAQERNSIKNQNSLIGKQNNMESLSGKAADFQQDAAMSARDAADANSTNAYNNFTNNSMKSTLKGLNDWRI